MQRRVTLYFLLEFDQDREPELFQNISIKFKNELQSCVIKTSTM